MIRQANLQDISRIAEILIFTKRMTYRPIFHDDPVSFGQMQVVGLAEQYINHPERLNHIWVYDDVFVKGLVTLRTVDNRDGRPILQVEELYVDVFFHREGIGRKLLSFAEEIAGKEGIDEIGLWVLEKNNHARLFYEKNGFAATVERKLEEGTTEYIVWYHKNLA